MSPFRSQERKPGFGSKWLWGGHSPLWVTACYSLCGVLWVVIGLLFIHGRVPEWAEDLSYVGITAVVVYFLTVQSHRAIRANETSLRESEDRLARILETNASGIVVCNEQNRITFANHAAERILGMERGSMIGLRNDDPAWELTDGRGGALRWEEGPVGRVQVSRMPVHDFQIGVRRRDGVRVFLAVNAAPLLDASGKMAGIVASFADITETKKAEDLKFRKLLLATEQSPSAIVITDLEGNPEYANPRYASMTGCTAHEFLARKLPHPCKVPPAAEREIREAIRSGNIWHGEFECLRKSGEPYWEATTVTPIRGADGEAVGLLWVRDDITDRKAAEEALRRSGAELKAAHEKFRNLVESVSDWVWETDGNGVYTYVSPKVRDILGYEPAEVLGKTSIDLMPDFEVRRVAEIFGSILSRRGPIVQLETIYRHRDGRFVMIETRGAPYFSAEGAFLGYRGVDRDVGERKRAEAMMRASEERFRQLFEQNEEPLFLFRSGSAEILDVNPAAEQLYGQTRDDILRYGLPLFVAEGEVRGFAEAVAGIRPGSGLSVERVEHLHRDGTRMIVSVRGKSVRLESGHVSYCSFRDITARVRMEEEGRLQQAQLIHANRMASLGTIVSGVAHEVNNPNNLIMFNAPMILSAWEDALPVLEAHFRENGDFPLGGLPYSEMREVVPRLAAGISDASSRIKAIVANIKDFARQDRSRGRAPVNVNDAVRTAVSIMNHEIIRATHRFTAVYAEGLPPVSASAQELEQVIVNLLNNALQALPSNHHGVRVTTRRDPDTGEVVVDVADEGCGMSPEVLGRIAEPFFSTRMDSGGLGLGLSICRSILKEHGGSLCFESEVGKGTRAIVRLPAVGAGAEPGPAKAATIASTGG